MIPPGAPTLRDYQHAAVAGVDRTLVAHRSALVVIATGGGKSVIAGELARRERMRGGRTLMLAHRDELLDQLAAKAIAAGVHAEIEQGPRRAGDAPVVVASVPTLARAKRLAGWARDAFTLLIADEAHHAPAASWSTILEYFGDAKLVGFTATPDRADGIGLGDTFEEVAYRLEIRELIAMEHLVPIRARRIVLDGVDVSRIATRAGDLAQDQLAAVMEAERAIAGVVTPLLEQTGSRQTIVFAASVKHAGDLAAAINCQRPGQAHVIHGELERGARRALLRDFAAGVYQFALTVDVLTEGVDIPETSCIAMVRPTKSRGRYVQAAGRGLRPAPRIGKRDCLLLDFSPTAGKHRLIGPVDVLHGDLADDLRAELDRLLGHAALRLDESIAAATGTVVQERVDTAAVAKVRWHAEQVDPFIGEQIEIAACPAGWGEARATTAQLSALRQLGLEAEKLPEGFTMADASRLIGRLAARRGAGLCSYAQARRLAPYGIDTRRLSAARASSLFGVLRAGNWKPIALVGQPEAGAEFHRRMQAAKARKLEADQRKATTALERARDRYRAAMSGEAVAVNEDGAA